MKRLALLLCLVVTGCSLISVQQPGSKSKKIPARPTTSRKLSESLSQEADLARRIAGDIHATGTEPRSVEAKMMLDASDKLLTYTGKPSTPVNPEDNDAVAELHKRFEKRIAEQRDREAKWESEVLQLREQRAELEAENGRLRWSFANLKWWLYLSVIALVVVMVVFPSTIPLIVGWAKKGVKALLKITRRQMKEVVVAVQAIRTDPKIPDDVKDRINAILRESQSQDTVEEIAALKKRHGIG